MEKRENPKLSIEYTGNYGDKMCANVCMCGTINDLLNMYSHLSCEIIKKLKSEAGMIGMQLYAATQCVALEQAGIDVKSQVEKIMGDDDDDDPEEEPEQKIPSLEEQLAEIERFFKQKRGEQ